MQLITKKSLTLVPDFLMPLQKAIIAGPDEMEYRLSCRAIRHTMKHIETCRKLIMGNIASMQQMN